MTDAQTEIHEQIQLANQQGNTMSRYMRKAVIIEAFQMTKERRTPNCDWPDWLNDAWQEDMLYADLNNRNGERLCISTRDRDCRLDWDDWIIQDPDNGKLDICKPEEFSKKYEAVSL